jgi:hypothetical protein
MMEAYNSYSKFRLFITLFRVSIDCKKPRFITRVGASQDAQRNNNHRKNNNNNNNNNICAA